MESGRFPKWAITSGRFGLCPNFAEFSGNEKLIGDPAHRPAGPSIAEGRYIALQLQTFDSMFVPGQLALYRG